MSCRCAILRSRARPAAALSAAAALFAGAAQAQEFTLQGSAALSGLRFEVVDLAPGDGVAAQYRVDPGAFTEVSTSLRLPAGFDRTGRSAHDRGWLAPGSSVLSHPGPGGSGASLAALEPGGLSASGALQSAGAGRFSARSQSSSQDPRDAALLAGLALSPHAQLTVSADYALSAFVDGPPCTLDGGCARLEVGTSFRWAGALQAGDTLGASLLLRDEAALPASRQDSGRLSFTLTNDTDAWGEEYLAIEAYVDGGVSQPVPEPGGAWLAAAGLLALGLARRRAA